MKTRRPSFLITGPRRAGKSTLCMDVLHFIRNSGGNAGGVITLQNSDRWIYLVLDDIKLRFEANNNEEFIQVGKFQIHRGNMQQAINHIERSLKSEYLFVDEIGILEMNRGGYYSVLEKAFSRNDGNIFVIRESILEEILDSYNITFNFQIIHLERSQYKQSLGLMKSEIEKCVY